MFNSDKVDQHTNKSDKTIDQKFKNSKSMNQKYDEDDFFLGLGGQEKVRDFLILKEIGQGAFGSVYLVQNEKTKKKYALKVINKDFLSRTDRTEEALIERLILSKCKHPSIVKLSLSFQSKLKLYFVIEYCPNKDLDDLLRKMGIFDNDLALQIIAEIVNAVDYLHNEMELSHNDLKPSNILLDANYHIKLIDFATAKMKGKIFDKKKGDFIPSDESVTKEIIGTAEFLSPEMVNQNITDYRTNDIWSLGVIIYIIFNGVSPFRDTNDFLTLDKVKECKFEYVNKKIPEDAIDLMNNILVEDTSKRFNIKQIKNHKYFKDINWETVINNKVPIDLEKLEELNKINIEKSNNENFWEQFCNDINVNNENINNGQEKDDFVVEKLDNFPIKINKDFFYSKEIMEKYQNDIENIKVGIVKKCGIIDKEVKIKVYISEKKMEILDLEKNIINRTIKINNKTKLKIDNGNEIYVDDFRFKTSVNRIKFWFDVINKIINS